MTRFETAEQIETRRLRIVDVLQKVQFLYPAADCTLHIYLFYSLLYLFFLFFGGGERERERLREGGGGGRIAKGTHTAVGYCDSVGIVCLKRVVTFRYNYYVRLQNRVPVVYDEKSQSLTVLGCVKMPSPFLVHNCQSTNEITLQRVKQLILSSE